MNPIFTISNENNLDGYWYDQFIYQFDKICEEHLENDRAKKFAFIVYSFHSPTHDVLKDMGAFVELDRLSGKDITVFFLDGQSNKEVNEQNTLYNNLNEVFLEYTGRRIRTVPFIFFFDFENGDVENIKCYPIRDNEKFILNDLTRAIKNELKDIQMETKKPESKSMIGGLIRETPKIVYTEFLKLILKGIYDPN